MCNTSSQSLSSDYMHLSDRNAKVNVTSSSNLKQSNSCNSHDSWYKTIPSPLVIVLWSVLTYTSKEFSLFLPQFQSHAGAKTFISAAYVYDEDETKFDNSFLTYGTDYGIGIIMMYAVYKCLTAASPNDVSTSFSKPLRIKSALLFFSYALSVFAGGYAHYTFHGVEALNTLEFRIWWTICVGSVTFAGGIMGSCGSEIIKHFSMLQQDKRYIRFHVPYVHDILWMIYGGFLTYVCVMGEISYKRPACDIFVAGTSQFLPTVYIVLSVLSIRWEDASHLIEGKLTVDTQEPSPSKYDQAVRYVRKIVRNVCYIGFFLNAPLLPSYPCYVQYTSLSLGVVNAILHLNLTFAWSMQAWSLRKFCLALNLVSDKMDEKKH